MPTEIASPRRLYVTIRDNLALHLMIAEGEEIERTPLHLLRLLGFSGNAKPPGVSIHTPCRSHLNWGDGNGSRESYHAPHRIKITLAWPALGQSLFRAHSSNTNTIPDCALIPIDS
ncbi:hypothetical protein NPIL_118301 [Nephila pilipes]|uniref:Uncharacterized protein n=1 Tax=Nephila pilipes TaxID=299642 RepID=A0A8X6TZ15_NEPPI|nr:hypothetical protein NPIL_118301 [Nephila pilipes]